MDFSGNLSIKHTPDLTCALVLPIFQKSFPQPAFLHLFFASLAQYNSFRIRNMAPLVIAVGTTRKPKLAAVYEAVSQITDVLAPGSSIDVIGVEVESGVSHTPASREELMRGARQRAESLQDIAKRRNQPWNFFVGLEGGLEVIRESGERRVFLESWAYVSDATYGHFGRSGAIELPPALADEVLASGTELSVAIDQFAGAVGIRDAQGAWGVLTANKISRQESFRVALTAAFAPFYNRTVYRKTVVAIQS